MEVNLKEDWLINNKNIFEFPKEIEISISAIHYEIIRQCENKSINSISEYLTIDIDLHREIRFTNKLTINIIITNILKLNFNPIPINKMRVSLILSWLQLSLFKKYTENKFRNILTFQEYQNQYDALKRKFLNSNIDTDEQDFVEDELKLCEVIVSELDKPIYNKLNILGIVTDEPCDFKRNLTNSIDKRRKYLNSKVNSLLGDIPTQQATTSKQEKKSKLKFNPSQFNKFTYKLFVYILDNYTTKGNIKYINIWYFLRNDVKKMRKIENKHDILFNFTQEKYKIFVKNKYNIQITKFQKANFKYDDNEVPTLRSVTENFLENMKKDKIT